MANFVRYRLCGKVAAYVFVTDPLMLRSSSDVFSPIPIEAKDLFVHEDVRTD